MREKNLSKTPEPPRYTNSWLDKQKRFWKHLLTRHGVDWTPAERTCLLECYLVRRLTAYYGEVNSYAACTGRSHRAVDSEGWKITVGYHGPYLPDPDRTDRTGTPFTDRDLAVTVAHFQSDSESHVEPNPRHLAAVLARSQEEVVAWVTGLARQGGKSPPAQVRRTMSVATVVKMTVPTRQTGESRWDWAVRVIAGAHPRVRFKVGEV